MREALGAARGLAGQVWGLVAPLASGPDRRGAPWWGRRPQVCAARWVQRSLGQGHCAPVPPLSLEQLDAFLAHARRSPSLMEQLQQPLELEALLALAATEGFAVSEADVIAAQAREEESLSGEELQRRAGQDARKLRTFIPG